MAVDNIWLLPVFISFYSVLTLLTCYSVAAYSHHVPPRWPFLSELAKQVPEGCLHSMMTNHMSIMLAVWMYIKHCEILSYLKVSTSRSPKWRTVSTLAMGIGLMAALSLMISANFPARRIHLIEGWATLTTSVLWSIYIFLHSILSLQIIDPSVPRKGIFLVRLALAMAVISFSVNTVKVFFTNEDFDRKNGEASWIASLCEWGVYYCLSLFLLTDSYEFRSLSISALKLIIPGSVLFDHVYEEHNRSRSQTETSDFDPRFGHIREPLVR